MGGEGGGGEQSDEGILPTRSNRPLPYVLLFPHSSSALNPCAPPLRPSAHVCCFPSTPLHPPLPAVVSPSLFFILLSYRFSTNASAHVTSLWAHCEQKKDLHTHGILQKLHYFTFVS
ncbi:hypothetical protein GPALN_016305 [Globodera pallida]|nr:hypothetical protein GPALN_016305 [Globodera pallida]